MKALLALALLCLPFSGIEAQGWDRRIVGREHFRDPQDVPRPFKRADDPLMGEMWFLVGDDGSFCRVTVAEWVMARDFENWRCRWRLARGM